MFVYIYLLHDVQDITTTCVIYIYIYISAGTLARELRLMNYTKMNALKKCSHFNHTYFCTAERFSLDEFQADRLYWSTN